MDEPTRLELMVDVLQITGQRAQVLNTLPIPEFIQAILDEFTEVEHLGQAVTAYEIVRIADRTLLDEQLPVGKQLRHGDQVRLQEKELTLPPGKQRPPHAVYLRELTGGRVYRLHWLPALIGRHDPAQPSGERLAVDLHDHAAGLRVSRRQAQIVLIGDTYYLETLAANPVLVVRGRQSDTPGDQESVPVTDRQPLYPGDVIQLARSKIMLRFLTVA